MDDEPFGMAPLKVVPVIAHKGPLEASKRPKRVQILDRLPPHSQEAEIGVLGCILLDPQQAMALCLERILLPEVWYDLRHREIWLAMVELYEQKIAIDPITLQQRLKDKQQLDAVGGLPYLMSLPDSVPSAANIEYYLDIVIDKHNVRSVIAECTRLCSLAYEWEDTADKYLDTVQQSLNRLAVHRYKANTHSIKSLAHEAICNIERSIEKKGAPDGIPTGFVDFDKLTWGMHPQEFIVVAARPSIGKTSFVMNIVEHVAIDLKLPCVVFSLEMSAQSLVFRMVCSRARVNGRTIRDGFLAQRDYPKLTQAAGAIAGSPIYIDDTRGCTSLQLRAKARRLQQEHGIRLAVVDYLQLTQSPRNRDMRYAEIGDVARDLQTLAGELNIPVIAISQLSRDMEREKGRRPRLSDLKESGDIEQAGDTIVLLYNKAMDDDEQRGDGDAQSVGAILGKNKNGPTAEFELTFMRGYTRFESAAKISEEAEQTAMPYKD